MKEIKETVAESINNASKPSPNSPRINTYMCTSCSGKVHTVDVSEGTTPMTLPCLVNSDSGLLDSNGDKVASCSGQMMSSFYSVTDVSLKDVDYEWRFATIPEYAEYRKKNKSVAEHVAQGGLILHKRSNKDSPVLTHGGGYVRPNGELLDDKESSTLKSGLEVLKQVLKLEVDKAKRKAHIKRMLKNKKKSKRKGKRKK